MCLGESDIAGMPDAAADAAMSVTSDDVTQHDVTQRDDVVEFDSVHHHPLLDTTNSTVIIGWSHSLVSHSLAWKDREMLGAGNLTTRSGKSQVVEILPGRTFRC